MELTHASKSRTDDYRWFSEKGVCSCSGDGVNFCINNFIQIFKVLHQKLQNEAAETFFGIFPGAILAIHSVGLQKETNYISCLNSIHNYD